MTLGEVVEAHFNLAVGRPAPEIDGLDLDGRPLKLSGFRGKVVVVIVWSGAYGPVVSALSRDPEIVARLGEKPLILLGVNCDRTPEAARKAIRDAGISWPNWADVRPDRGTISDRYSIRGLPTFLVIDAKGTLRSRALTSMGLVKLVDRLLAEIDPAK
jgi:hypothetical protein